jgi:hypothetical protein
MSSIPADGSTSRLPGGGEVAVTATPYGPVRISGAPDADPNGVFESLVERLLAGSYDININNDVAVDGSGEGCSWVVDMPTGWVDDGSKMVAFRLTLLASPPNSVDFWVTLGVCDLTGDAPNAAANPLTMGFVRTFITDRLIVQTRTSQTIKPGTDGTVIYEAVWLPGGTLSSLDDVGVLSARSAEDGLATSVQEGAAADGNVRVIVCAGCNDSGGSGTHTARVLLEMALLDLPTG